MIEINSTPQTASRVELNANPTLGSGEQTVEVYQILNYLAKGGYTGTAQDLQDQINQVVATGGGTPTGGYQGTSQELQTQILAMGDPDFDFEQQVDTLLTF